jgi:hypothetical protein
VSDIHARTGGRTRRVESAAPSCAVLSTRLVVIHAHRSMNLFDCFHCFLCDFHFFRKLNNLILNFRHSVYIAVYRGDHRLEDLGWVGHIGQCDLPKRLLHITRRVSLARELQAFVIIGARRSAASNRATSSGGRAGEARRSSVRSVTWRLPSSRAPLPPTTAARRTTNRSDYFL